MKYYYNKDGKNYGPVTLEELIALAEKGEILNQTPVIEVGKKEWMRWAKLAETLQSEPEPEPEPAPAPAPAPAPRPALRATAPRPAPRAAAPRPAPRAQQAAGVDVGSIISKIHQVYESVDRICEKICSLPAGLTGTPEKYRKTLTDLGAAAGVGTLICALSIIVSYGLYQNVGVMVAMLLVGAVLQYICYQMYNAMIPLLFSNKIKLSSLWLPRTLALLCALLTLGYLVFTFQDMQISTFVVNLGIILLLLMVSFSCVNCTKFSVELSPEEVVPGQELINLFRFLTRIIFTTVHLLTPLYMILAAIGIMFMEQKFGMPKGVPMDFSSLFFLVAGDTLLLGIAVLPIFTLPLFYVCSFIPDFIESFFNRK